MSGSVTGAAADGQDLPTEPFRNTGRRQASEGGRDERTVGGHDVRSAGQLTGQGVGVEQAHERRGGEGGVHPARDDLWYRSGQHLSGRGPHLRAHRREEARNGRDVPSHAEVTHETQQSTAAAPATVAVTTRRRVAAVAVQAGRRSRIVPTRAARATATAALTSGRRRRSSAA